MDESFYPPGPATVPPGLNRVQTRYRLRAVAVLLGIFLFLAVYLCMVAAAGYFAYFSIVELSFGTSRWSVLGKLGTIAFSVMLFVFLLKFLFKRQQINNPLNIEIKEHQHPKLFQFVRNLCRDTRAPFPKKIFINHECNAAVFYNTSILSLFWPVKKNLLIGLGLMDFLNLSELKAIVAHEFGHFSQKSMKLGSYIYMANRIVYDMVYERDSWDDLLTKWKQLDIRLSIFGYFLSFFVWILRHILGLFYMGLNLLHASLSRQMELHADLVAVSVTGSDAIVNSLARVQFASQCIQFADHHIHVAADHKLFTRNIFYHRQKAAEHLRKVDPDFVERFDIKSDSRHMFFRSQGSEKPSMFDSHPTNYQREKNAKKQYVANTVDNRPASLLLENFLQFSEQVTQHLYKVSGFLPENAALKPPEEVEAFILGEVDEMHYDPRYRGIYDDRFITTVDLETVETLKGSLSLDETQLEKEYHDLYGDEFEAKMKRIHRREKDMETVVKILTKENKSKMFTVGDKMYNARQAEVVFNTLQKEDEADKKWYEPFDRRVLAVHYLMAKALSEAVKSEFLLRYGFHFKLQEVLAAGQGARQKLNELLIELSDLSELDEDAVGRFTGGLDACRQAMVKMLDRTCEMTLPPLQNMEEVTSIRSFLMEDEPVYIMVGQWEPEKIDILITQLGSVIGRVRRLHFKSLGGILTMQEQIAREYLSAAKIEPTP